MEKRRVIQLLPQVHQTETLKKFFGATIDHLFQNGASEHISGYIGAKPSYFDPNKDFYVPEPTTQRAEYQLEPALISRNKDGEATHIFFYDDLINYLKSVNAFTNNHHRLFADEYYNWAPPVDIDKLMNPSQYYWFGDDPEAIPVCILRSEFRKYVGDGVEVSFELPGKASYASGEEVPERYETPCAFVDGMPVVAEVDGDNIVLETAPPEGADVTVFRYGDLTALFDGRPMVDVTAWLPDNSPIQTITSGLRIRLDDGVSFFQGWDTLPWETLFLKQPIRCSQNYEIGWDQYKRSATHWVEGVGSKAELVPFQEKMTIPGNGEPIYVVIDRRSRDRNPWSINNFWVHKDAVEWAGETFTERKAKRPIIEFVPNIELANYGTRYTGEISALLTGELQYLRVPLDDPEDFMAVSDWDVLPYDEQPYEASGFENISVFEANGKPVGTLFTDIGRMVRFGDRILALDVEDQRVRSRIIEIYRGETVEDVELEDGIITTSIESFAVVLSDFPRKGDIVRLPVLGHIPFDNRFGYDKQPWVYSDQPVDFYFDGTQWQVGQKRNFEDSDPLFALYTHERISHADIPGSEFAGNRLFGFAKGSGVVDTVTGRPLVYESFGSSRAEILFENDIVTRKTVVNGEKIKGLQFYRIAGETPEEDVYGSGWHATAEKVPPRMRGDLFLVPMSLSANPDNDEPTTISRGHWFDHFSALIARQEGFQGVAYRNNNWRDTRRSVGPGFQAAGLWDGIVDYKAGDTVSYNAIVYRCLKDHRSGEKFEAENWEERPLPSIVQHRSPLLRTMLLASDKRFDYLDTVRFVDSEYQRFRNKFIAQVVELHTTGALLETDDDAVWVDTILNALRITKTNEFPFSLSTVGGGQYFIPPSPSALGLLPVVEPGMEIDDTYGEPVPIIRGHDGSRSFAFGDIRDRILLALETLIWRNIDSSFKTDAKPEFDFADLVESRARLTNKGNVITRGDPNPCDANNDPVELDRETYSQEEYVRLYTPIFMRWAQLNGYDYKAHNDYVEDDPFTWNYRGVKDRDGVEMPGNWRAIYRWWFDTDRPHLAPWEMLGFASKPSWWDNEYGPAPYTSGNLPMWEDIRDGIIRHGERKGVDARFRRPDLLEVLPVDDQGRLLDPIAAGIIPEPPSMEDAKREWRVGDHGPVENIWINSASYPFAKAQVGYLMRPAEWIETGWDRLNRVRLPDGQWINRSYGNRPRGAEELIHGEIDEDGNRVVRVGIQQWISDYMASNSQSPSILGDAIRGMSVCLAHKMAGFTNAKNLRVFADNFGLLPPENVEVLLHSSAPIREAVYSGVLIEWTGEGWKIIGYDTVKEGFCIIGDPNEVPGDKGSDGSKQRVISLGEDTPIYEWRPNVYYQTNQIVEYQKSYYRAIRAHTASAQFEDEYWSPQPGEMTKKFPKVVIQERNVEWKNPDFKDVVYKYVPYSTVFKTQTELAQFLWDYGLTLEREGFVFDEVDPVTGEVLNWEYAIREFLKWAQMDWQPGNFIALSPGASTLKFVSRHGTVYNVEKTHNGVYGLLNRTGAPIPPRSTFISRLDDETKIITTTDDLFAARLHIGEIEHILVFSDRTIFNDIVYAPLYNLRQPRLRLIGQRSADWKGRLDAPGYVISGSEMLANYDRASENIRVMYDIERSEDRNFRDYARHQIGYQTRKYLDNLLLSETQQFETYQGMIQSKGSADTLNRLTRSQVIDDKRQLGFLEEWAFQVGRYGALNKRQRVSFRLLKSDIRNNPQLITFASGNPFDAFVDVPADSDRWVERPATLEMFRTRDHKDEFVGIGSPLTRPWVDDLPTAGPVRIDEIHFTVAQYSAFPRLYDLVSMGVGNEFGAGTRIWVYDTLKRDISWDVLQLYPISTDTTYLKRIEGIEEDGNLIGQFRMVFSQPHGLTEDDTGIYILISDTTDTEPDVAGFHRVGRVESDQTLIIDEYLDRGADYTTTIRPVVYVLRSQRFASTEARDAFYERFPARHGDICYVQPVDGPWVVYRWSGEDWEVYREQPAKIDSSRLKAALIYDTETKIEGRNTITALPVLLDDITVYDPVAGLIPGVAEREITWKFEYDPAIYHGEARWGREQVGRLWWNLGAVNYLVCETDRLDVEDEDRRKRELEYRAANWGRLAPGTEIEIYEWVRSSTPPETYNGETHNAPYTSYVRSEEWDADLNTMVTVYYFWVKNSDREPVNIPGRKMSARRVAEILRNPKAQNIPWIAPITENSILVSGIEQFLGEETSVLQFEIEDEDIDGVVHDEWQLIRAEDSMTVLPETIWRPLRNSLVGRDDFGKPVPDMNLSPDDRIGLSIYPRRTLFDGGREGLLAARKAFVDTVNDIFSRESFLSQQAGLATLLDLNSPTFGQLFWKRPIDGTAMVLPPVGSYDYEVSSLAERNALLSSYEFQVMRGFLPWEETAWDEAGWEFDTAEIPTVTRRSPRILVTNYEAEQPSWGIWELDETAPLDVDNPDQYLRLATLYDIEVATRQEMVERASEFSYGTRILVRNDETAQGFWAVYSYVPGALKADLDGFMLTSVQSYRTTDFWTAVDWYAEGYSKLNPPIVSYPTIEARNIHEMPRPVNTFVKVEDDGTGAWVWTAYINGSWEVVACEKGTVRLSSKFYDDERIALKDDNLDVDMIRRRDGSLELRAIIDALRSGVFTNSQINELFFSMLHFIHTQQQNIPWAFKTSFMSIVGFNETLFQSPVKRYDQTDNIVSYIEEVKPYRVKVRDFARTLAPDIDRVGVHVSDFDKPVYFDETLGRHRTLDPRRDADMAILTTMSPWKDWAENFAKGSRDPASSDFNPIRRMLLKMRFDRVDHQEVPLDSGLGWDLGPMDVLGFDGGSGGSHGGSALARMLAFYRPGQGMREKKIETLLGLTFKGVVTDGGDLFQPNDFEYSDWDVKGYDSLPWETLLTAEKDLEIDGNGVEEVEVALNPTGDAKSHYKLNDPYRAPNHPEELISVQSNTAISMTVETGWTVGAPRQYTAYVNTKRARRSTVSLSYGGVASSADAVFVYRDGVRAREGIDYTVDHHARKVEVQLGSPRAQKVMVHVMGHGGLTAICGQTFLTGDGITTEYDLPFETRGAVEITVDGRRMPSNEAYISDGRVVFVNAPANGADICFTEFEPLDGVTNPATNVAKESLLVHDEQRWTLATPSRVVPTEAIGTIVELNGKRLTPPFIRVGGFSTKDRYLPFTKINDVNNIRMWIDGDLYTGEINSVPGEERELPVTKGWDTYEWDMAEEVYSWATVEDGLDCRPLDTDLLDVRADFVLIGEHIFANNINFLPENVIAIGYEGHDYDVEDGELTIYTPIGESDYDIIAWEEHLWDDAYTIGTDTRVEVTTFENASALGIAAHVFDGSPSGMYEIPVAVEDSQYVWVWVNGHRLISGVDYDTAIETPRWDGKSFDHVGVGLDSRKSRVLVTIPGGQEPHERVVIMTFSGKPVVPPSTWGMHTAVPSPSLMGDPVLGVDFGFAPLDTVPLASTVARKAQSPYGERTLYRMNGSWELYDWTDDVRITLASPLGPEDGEIVLRIDADDYPEDMLPVEMLPEPDLDGGVPGVVFINGERIEYFEKEVSGQEVILRELRRGTRGTREACEHRIVSMHRGDGSTNVFYFPGAVASLPLEVSLLSEDGSLTALQKDIHFAVEEDADGLTVTLYRIPKKIETVRLAQTTSYSHPVGSLVRSGQPATVTTSAPFRIREEVFDIDLAKNSRVYVD